MISKLKSSSYWLSYWAFSLVLIAPFLDFLRFNNYSYFKPEVILVGLILIVIGCFIASIYQHVGLISKIILIALLLTFSLSFFPEWSALGALILVFFITLALSMIFLKDVSYLLAVIFSVFTLSILFLPMQSVSSKPVDWNHVYGKAKADLPPIVYIILDEHVGIEAIPTETEQGVALKKALKAFYLSNDFQLYGRAYSHYPNTYNSVPNLLNFTASNQDNFYFNATYNRHLKSNKFFALLAQKGYQFRIYQGGDYLDYCQDAGIPITSCYSFPTISVDLIRQVGLPTAQRFIFLMKSFLLQSSFYQLVMETYQYQLQPVLRKHHWPAPDWEWDEARVSSLAMLGTFKQLSNDITQHPTGTVFFAHIFAPHSPYVYDANCQLLPVDQWRVGTVQMPGAKNTPQSRAVIYATYEGQTACVQKQLQMIFTQMRAAGIYDQALIIVHGDHGSRIALHKPYTENQAQLTEQDFKDYYLTLFAVKMPGVKAGYNTDLVDLQTLLARYTYPMTQQMINVPVETPYVYLLPQTVGVPLERVDLPI